MTGSPGREKIQNPLLTGGIEPDPIGDLAEGAMAAPALPRPPVDLAEADTGRPHVGGHAPDRDHDQPFFGAGVAGAAGGGVMTTRSPRRFVRLFARASGSL